MFVFENHLFQPPSQPKNPRLTESSALKACYCWLPDGRSINHKNLDYEIETNCDNDSDVLEKRTINHKNLDYEIETSPKDLREDFKEIDQP